MSEDKARFAEAAANAVGSVRAAGLEPSPELLADLDRAVEGEIGVDELVDRTMQRVQTAEEAAAEALEELRARPMPVAPPRLVACIGCRGTGVDPSPWAVLWGYNCWLCGGWGPQVQGIPCMRGPFAGRPGR